MLFKIKKTGLSHRNSHRPCQDYCMTVQTDSMQLLLAADGHGGTPYSRSGLGARIACLAASKVLSDTRIPAEECGKQIKKKFDHYIKKHLKLHPLTDSALEKLGTAPPEYAYGTTLLAVRITGEGTLLLQIGDGEIHAVSETGTFFSELPEDPNCIGNFTSSLVTEDAAKHIRAAFYPRKTGCLLLHSDGFEPDDHQVWNLFSSIGENFTFEQLKKAALEGDRRGDDQTILLYYDESIASSSRYLSGLRKTIQYFELLKEKERFLRQLAELNSYLETAMEFFKDRRGEERAQLLGKMKQRYKEFLETKAQIWEIELKIQGEHPYRMYVE